MTQFMGRFSVTAGARSLEVCRAAGTHAEPDSRGRCFMCGLLLPDPELEIGPIVTERILELTDSLKAPRS